MTDITVSEARQNLSDVIDGVAFKGERVILSRNGKPVAALVSPEDLAVLAEIEDRDDAKAARKALREKGGVTLNQLKAELGL